MVAVPTPLDWVANAGAFASAALLQAGVGLPLAFLLDPPRCVVRQTVTQPIPHSSFTALTFTTEDSDNEATASHLSGSGMHDPAVNPQRITARTAGTYMLAGAVSFPANTAGRRGCKWTVNGTDVPMSQALQPAPSTGALDLTARVKYVQLVAGDYVELRAFQDSGGALNTAVTSPGGADASVCWVRP